MKPDFLVTISLIVEAAGLRRPFERDPVFCLFVKNPPWLDLVIESRLAPHDGSAPSHPHGPRIRVAHLSGRPGDLSPDPQVEITLQGDVVSLQHALGVARLHWLERGIALREVESRREIRSYLNRWPQQLVDRGYIEAARRVARRRLRAVLAASSADRAVGVGGGAA